MTSQNFIHNAQTFFLKIKPPDVGCTYISNFGAPPLTPSDPALTALFRAPFSLHQLRIPFSHVARSFLNWTWNECTRSSDSHGTSKISTFHQALRKQQEMHNARALTVTLVISKHYRKFPASSWIFIRTINKASVALACLRKICNIVARSFPAFLRQFLRIALARHWRVVAIFGENKWNGRGTPSLSSLVCW